MTCPERNHLDPRRLVETPGLIAQMTVCSLPVYPSAGYKGNWTFVPRLRAVRKRSRTPGPRTTQSWVLSDSYESRSCYRRRRSP
jgi:hypothetical protein